MTIKIEDRRSRLDPRHKSIAARRTGALMRLNLLKSYLQNNRE